MKAIVHRKARPRCQRHALTALAAFRGLARLRQREENIGFIRLHHGVRLIGVGMQPGPDGLKRNVLFLQCAPLNQCAPDRGVRATVLRRINRARFAAVVEDEAARPLHLQKKQRHRIFDIEQRPGFLQTMRFDFRAAGIRQQAPFHHAARDLFALQGRIE